jgi:hypothetical protein
MARYWFRPRCYGYRATPATWEGWTVTLIVPGIVIGSIVGMDLRVDRSDFTVWMIWALVIASITFWFVCTARERNDSEWRWCWGDRTGTTKTRCYEL